MVRYKYILLGVGGLTLVLLVGAFFLVFSPLGLGPEPDTVLTQDFFATPAASLDDLELMVGGEAAFEEILAGIEAAQKSIYVQTYIWKDDDIGGRVVEKLRYAADRGVTVTIRKDVLGTIFEIGDLLKGKPSPVYSGAGLKGYPNIFVATDVFADTDHSKYFVIDKQLAIFGGMNIADEYHTQWHDYMVSIRSERWAAMFAQKAIYGEPWPAVAPFVVAVNNRKVTEIRTALIQIIDHAAKQIIIEHAYFSDDKVLEAVQRAADRGIEVIVILPRRPDTHIYANQVTINRLLELSGNTKMRIVLFPRMSHAKVVMTDGAIAAVGSANLTPRSMLTSKELTLFVHGKTDDPFIEKLRKQLTKDIAQSEPVLKPFEFSVPKWIMAVAGKYVW
jgi:cardiolipin synthase